MAARRAFSTCLRLREQQGDNKIIQDVLAGYCATTNKPPRGYSAPESSRKRSISDHESFNAPEPGSLLSPAHLTPEKLLTATNKPSVTRPKVGPPTSQIAMTDPFVHVDFTPKDIVLNPFVLADYVSDLGRIHPRAKTGLSYENQRKVAKAIRRARAMGLMSRWSKPGASQSRDDIFYA